MKSNATNLPRLPVTTIFFLVGTLQAMAGTTHIVNQFGMSFSPANITVQVGDVVEWRWSSGLHTVTSGSPCTHDNQFFDENLTSVNSIVTFAIPNDGTTFIPYFCRPHCGVGMTGTITISIVCGDGFCNGSETACTCAQDGCVPACGDGCCNGSEDGCNCPQDGCAPACGDGCCNGSENECTCPQDGCAPACGDGCCNGNETACTCPGDGCIPSPGVPPPGGGGACQLWGDVFPFDIGDPDGFPVGNCVVDIGDLLVVLGAFAESPAHCPTFPDDVNLFPCSQACADGVVDIDDVLVVLLAFAGAFSCPHACEPGACCGVPGKGNPCPNGNDDCVSRVCQTPGGSPCAGGGMDCTCAGGCLDWDRLGAGITPTGGMSQTTCASLGGIFTGGCATCDNVEPCP